MGFIKTSSSLGHRLVKHHDNSISISLQQDYYLNMLKPYNLHHDNVRPVTTTCAEPPRILPQDHLSAEDHRSISTDSRSAHMGITHQTRPSIPSQNTYSSSASTPSSFDLKNLKHTLRYIKGTQHLRLVLGKDLHRYTGQPLDQLHPLDIKCFTDSDWAGDQESRKSTSGFVISIFNTSLSFHQRHRAALLSHQLKLSSMLWHQELQMPSSSSNCWKRSKSTSASRPSLIPDKHPVS